MMPSAVSSDPNSVEQFCPVSEQQIAEWAIGQRTVRLIRKPNQRLAFSTNQPAGRTTTFRSTLYSIDYAISLIFMFHHTIGVNLEKEEHHSSCFLPMLCIEAHQEPGMQVALFGRVDARTNSGGELKGLRWGVFNTLTKEEETFEVGAEDVARLFIRQSPNTNHSRMISGVDKKGKPTLKPGPDHYAMNSYAKRFSAVLTRNPITHRIENIALHRVSLIDRNVFLDENNWAVTLVSGLNCSDNMFSRLFKGEIGHAMLACEGVKENNSFLKYIHLTQFPHDRNPELIDKEEAQLESFDMLHPLDTINGPTWIRSKNLVEKMFEYVSSKYGKRLKFAYSATFFLAPSFLWRTFKARESGLEGARAAAIASFPDAERIPLSCFRWAEIIARECGIIFCGSVLNTVGPIKKIEAINASHAFTLPSNFDPKHFGVPFSGENRQLSQKMLSARVLLVSNDCRPEEVSSWARQWEIEDDAAGIREYKRIQNARTFEEMFRRDYEPLSW